jgi:hypothetical protein
MRGKKIRKTVFISGKPAASAEIASREPSVEPSFTGTIS